MDDLISRQEALIKSLESALLEHKDGSFILCSPEFVSVAVEILKELKTLQWSPCSERLPGKEKTENDYIAEFIKERHPYMLDSFAFSAWKIKHSCYELVQTFKKAAQENKEAWDSAWNGVDELETDGYTVQQRGTVVTCGINKCKHNDDGLCKAESIYLSEDHDCDGGCDDGWDIDEEEEEE